MKNQLLTHPLESESNHVVIVALTADAMASSREACLEAGMDDYLNKPLRFEDLTEAIQKWMAELSSGSRFDGELTKPFIKSLIRHDPVKRSSPGIRNDTCLSHSLY